MKAKIREYVKNVLRDSNIKDNDSILESEIINSLFLIQLVLYLEKTFDVEIEKEDLKLENFDCINTIYEFVSRKIRARD